MRQGRMTVAVVVTGAVFLVGAKLHSTPEEHLGQLRKLVRAKRWSDASKEARALDLAVASKAPLEVLDPQSMAAPAEGLGMYAALPDRTIRGEELFLYAQVRNHGIREVAGWYHLHLVSDLVILNDKSEEIARDDGFGESKFSAKVPHRDTFVNIAVRVKGLPSGAYTARLVIHDRIGGKKGSAEIPFIIP